MGLGGLGTLSDDAFDGRAHQFHLMALRSLDYRANRHPMPLSQHAAFDSPLPRSVGLGPVFFPAQRSFRHRSIHTQPIPIHPAHLIELLDSSEPSLEKDACFHPLLKAIVRGRMRTQVGLVEGLPLASSSQNEEDGVGTVSIWHAWPSAAKAMRIDMRWQQRLEDCPQLIGNARILSSSHYSAFAAVCVAWFLVRSYLLIVAGYSDRQFKFHNCSGMFKRLLPLERLRPHEDQ